MLDVFVSLLVLKRLIVITLNCLVWITVSVSRVAFPACNFQVNEEGGGGGDYRINIF